MPLPGLCCIRLNAVIAGECSTLQGILCINASKHDRADLEYNMAMKQRMEGKKLELIVNTVYVYSY